MPGLPLPVAPTDEASDVVEGWGVTRMPFYEFHCRKCDKPFSVTLTIKEREAGKIACPTCGSKDAEPLLSSFFAKTSKKS